MITDTVSVRVFSFSNMKVDFLIFRIFHYNNPGF